MQSMVNYADYFLARKTEHISNAPLPSKQILSEIADNNLENAILALESAGQGPV